MKKPWSLKARANLVSVGMVFGMIIVLSIIIYSFMSAGFENLELNFAKKNTLRSTESFKSIVLNFDKKIIDWAEWDDTYKFIKDLNKEYILSNLGETTMNNLQVDEILFFDELGNIRYATAPAEVLLDEPTFPEDVENLLIDNEIITNELSSQNKSSGLIKTEDGILMYSAHSITKSNGTGDPIGTLVFARYIGPWLAEEMSNIIQLPVVLDTNPIHGANDKNTIIVDAKNKKIYGHFLLSIVNDTNKVALQFEMNRDIWLEGMKSMTYLLLAAGVVAIAMGTVNYLVLYKIILKDLLKFKNEVSGIAKMSGEGVTTKQGLNLEIDDLRENVNSLLNIINESKKTTENKVNELDKMNKLMIGRELKMIELKKRIQELEKVKE
jgi:sensor domain CHASE-containing protein